ncbi:MAG: glycosyltransferase, partial [Nitrospirae bacterium]
DIPGILKSIDLFVLPTLQEALGTSFMEAMAMERPVIGTNVDGVGEVIKNGLNGYLIEPNNPSVLAETIIKTLQDKDRARIMGKEGRKMVLQNYTVEKMYEGMYGLYSSLLEGKKL